MEYDCVAFSFQKGFRHFCKNGCTHTAPNQLRGLRKLDQRWVKPRFFRHLLATAMSLSWNSLPKIAARGCLQKISTSLLASQPRCTNSSATIFRRRWNFSGCFTDVDPTIHQIVEA
jgi:hypothetical protein